MKSKSKFFSLEKADYIKGIILAILTPVAVELQRWVDATMNGIEPYHLDPKRILMCAIGGFIGYLLKNLFTDYSKDETRK